MKPVSVRARRASGTRAKRRTPSRGLRDDRAAGVWSPAQAVYFDLLTTFVRRENHALVPYDHREGNFLLGN